MTQAQQPEALRLADNLEANRCHRAAAMLRTQHARIAELEATPAAQAVEPPDFDLRTCEGGRGFVAWYFSNVLQRYDYEQYITTRLAGDFACDLAKALLAAPAPAAVAVPSEVVEALEMLENGALNVAENAKNRGDGYDEGYANAMAKMARETLDALAATPPAQAQSFVREPDAWAAVHFGGKRAGKIYNTCETEQQCKDYIEQVHRSSDSITLADPQPVYVGTAPQAQDVLLDADIQRAVLAERERICAAIKAEDDHCVTQGDYMLDSEDCIKVVRGEWVRPVYEIGGAASTAQKGGEA